jgi:predicted nucleic acid-binding protein
MSHPKAPVAVKEWAGMLPPWVVVRSTPQHLKETIIGLGKGETSAIAIAVEIGADAILMDDRKATREALKNGLNTLSTFALLELASKNQLIDFAEAIHSRSETNFHLPPDEIIQEFLKRNI